MAEFEQGGSSLANSRASISSSSTSNYELLPRQEAYQPISRDTPVLKASNPFKKVQSVDQFSRRNSVHSQLSNKSVSLDRKLEMEEELKEQSDSNRMNYQLELVRYGEEIKRLEDKISYINQQLQAQRYASMAERKQNQIYRQNFNKIHNLLRNYTYLESQSFEQALQKLQMLLERQPNTFEDVVIVQQKKIQQLRQDLLKSNQNNINAIFQTEITESQCLEMQIHKMNKQIELLEEKLVYVVKENQRLNYQNRNMNNKCSVYYYCNQNDSIIDKELGPQLIRVRKNRHKQHAQKQRSRSRSDSSTSKKKSKGQTDHQISQLAQGYRSLKNEYVLLEQTLKQLTSNQSDYKQLFTHLKQDITSSIENQLKQVKETVKFSTSTKQDSKVAYDVQTKLNHLINTLNAPEKARVQIYPEQDNESQQKITKAFEKIYQLEGVNSQMQQKINSVNFENELLQNKIKELERINQTQKTPHNQSSHIRI